MSDGPRVVVVGAGIVGACCAIYLQRQGMRVTVIDRLAPGEATSFGNAGSLSWSSCVPIAVPGMLGKLPGWLLRSDGPLTIRWRHLPRLTPWLLRFLRSGTRSRLAASVPALAALHSPSLDLHRGLAADAGVPELIAACDYTHVFSSRARLEASRYQLELRREHTGATYSIVDGDALREGEPALSPHYACAARIHDQGFATNPGRLVKAYVRHLVARGGELVEDEVVGLDVSQGRVTAVNTNAGSIGSDVLVIAAGPWSGRVCRWLGLRLPLESERGYHVTIAQPGVSIGGTIMETDGMFVATPMEMGLRFAGSVELADVDTPPDYRRADVILERARRMLPGLRTEGVERWMGRRPSLPDGLPVIGAAPRHANVYLAFGHAHTGMVGAPQTGRLIAGMISGRPLNMDASPFRAERFG